MSTPRSLAGALAAGRCYKVEWGGPCVLRCEVSGRPLMLPYGLECYWADSPEEAAAWFRRMWPCSDRLHVEVRQIVGETRGCRLIEDAPVYVDRGVWT